MKRCCANCFYSHDDGPMCYHEPWACTTFRHEHWKAQKKVGA